MGAILVSFGTTYLSVSMRAEKQQDTSEAGTMIVLQSSCGISHSTFPWNRKWYPVQFPLAFFVSCLLKNVQDPLKM
jgi:hypothetical protein